MVKTRTGNGLRVAVVDLTALVIAACGPNLAPTPTSTAQPITAPTGSATAPAAVLPTASPTGAPISVSSLTGKIAYSHEGDIYLMDADGSGVTRLTTDPAMDFDPAWSPDGTRIVFRSHRDGNEEIYVMNADGSGQTNLTDKPGADWSPAWSPDGTRIAFHSSRPGGNGIWVMNADGSNPVPVATPPGVNDYPTWSPDSQRIAWNCTLGRYLDIPGQGDFEICVVNADGTGLVQLTDTDGNNKFPAWSPDGSKIAFVSDRNGWPTLPDYTPPEYSPEDFGDKEIFIMNADGSNPINLTNYPRAGDEFPAWSRDGRIVFTRGGGCLMVMNVEDALQGSDGSGLVQVSKGSCTGMDSGHFPDWFQP